MARRKKGAGQIDDQLLTDIAASQCSSEATYLYIQTNSMGRGDCCGRSGGTDFSAAEVPGGGQFSCEYQQSEWSLGEGERRGDEGR